MIQKTKYDACIANVEYLQIIFYLGRGIMLVKQLQTYMLRLEGQSNSTVYKNLRTLEKANVIEFNRFYNNNYIKLKKYALEFILNSNGNKIKSITKSHIKIKRSIFQNQYILNNYNLEEYTTKELINKLRKETTIFAKDKESHKVLHHFYKSQSVKANPILEDEIIKLQRIRKAQLMNLSKTEHDITFQEDDFNINNMQSRNIHITNIIKTTKKYGPNIMGAYLIEIVIFDIKDTYTISRLYEVLSKVHTYMHTLMYSYLTPHDNLALDINVKVHMTNEISIQRINRDIKLREDAKRDANLNTIEKDPYRELPVLPNNISYELVDLDLTNKAFGGVKIII